MSCTCPRCKDDEQEFVEKYLLDRVESLHDLLYAAWIEHVKIRKTLDSGFANPQLQRIYDATSARVGGEAPGRAERAAPEA